MAGWAAFDRADFSAGVYRVYAESQGQKMLGVMTI
jgi:hypothetical protein